MAPSVPVLLQWFENHQEKLLRHPMLSSLFLLSLFLLLWFNQMWPKKTINSPPSPPKLPIIGHLHHLGKLPHRSLHALSKEYGPLMLLQLGQFPTLVVSSAEMGKEIMKTHDVIFANRPVSSFSKAFVYGSKDLSHSPHGESWRQMRKICVLDVLSIKRVQSFRFVREEEITKMVNKIKQSCSEGSEVNLSALIVTFTNNLISRISLGRSLEGELGKREYTELTKETIELLGILSVEDIFPSFGWVDALTRFGRRLKKTSQAMHQFFDEAIEEHLMARKSDAGQADGKDFLDVLLAYENDATLGFEFTRQNLKALVMDMFVAGTDTTYVTLEWAMAELVKHPNVMKKLQEEVRLVVGEKSEVKENEIYKMVYLNCVIKETLRLHPPAALMPPRVSTADTTIAGYNVPANTRVLINAWAIARDPKHWDKPDEFIPERFINNPVDFRGQDFEFIPFGAGRRGCPGISFGIISIETALVNLLYWFDWKSPCGEDIDMTESPGLGIHKNIPLLLHPLSPAL